MSRTPVPILLLVRELGLGGSERQLAETAKSLDRARWRPFVGCFQAQGMRAEELRGAGVPIVEFPARSFYHYSTLGEARHLGRFVREQGIQLVHSFDVPTNLFAAPAAWVHRTPVVLTSQRAYRDLTPGMHRTLLRMTDRLVDGIVVNCEAMRKHLEEDERVPKERIHVCYNGLDLRALSIAPREEKAGVTIGVICALRPEKGLRTLVEAFASVHRAKPQTRLLIVGSGPMLGELKQMCRDLALNTSSYHFEPATSQVAAWLAKIDIFVLPSLSEALSNSLMEAMACGCTAVASQVGGNPELVREGETGFTFPANDPVKLADSLKELVDDEPLRRAMAQSGARLIRENFSVEKACARMDEIYSLLLEKHSRKG